MASLAALTFSASCGQKGYPTLRSFEKPHQITAMRALHRGDEIILSWDRPAETKVILQGLEIERAVAASREAAQSEQDFRLIARLPGDAAGLTDEDVRAGTRYLYRLRPVSARGVYGDFSPVLDVIPEEPPPAPRGLRYTVNGDSVEISWERLEGDVLYDIYRSRQAGAQPGAPRNTAPLEESRFTDKADPAGIVFYSVKAFRRTALRDEGPLSQELEVNPATFRPGPPEGLRFVSSDRAVFLLWRENPEPWVRGYRIYRKGPSDPDLVLIGFSAGPAFRDEAPPASHARYCISAQGPAAESFGGECVEVARAGER
jgi:hypothetical protein